MSRASLQNCDCCGRFMRPMDNGASWVYVPDSYFTHEEIRYRCASCTGRYGPATSNQMGVKIEMCSGVIEKGGGVMASKTIPAVTIITCDLCKRDMHPRGDAPNKKATQIKVRRNALDMHGDAACDASYSLDLCDDCEQWLTATLNEKERDRER